MKNFKPEEYLENDFGIIVRNRKYAKAGKIINFTNKCKNRILGVTRFVFAKISVLIRPIAVILINITAIAIEIFLSSRAYISLIIL